MGVLDLVSFAFTIFSIKWPSMNGPFLIERPIVQKSVEFHRAAVAPDNDKTIGILLPVACVAAFGDLAPRRHELLPTAAGFRLAGAAAVRVIDRVTRNTTIDRPDAAMP